MAARSVVVMPAVISSTDTPSSALAAVAFEKLVLSWLATVAAAVNVGITITMSSRTLAGSTVVEIR